VTQSQIRWRKEIANYPIKETVMKSSVKTVSRPIFGYAAAVWLACGLVTSNAHAGDARSETVKFADLDLSSQEGVEALYGRIHAAARHVCDQPAGELPGVGRCMSKAEAEAISKVNLASLTAFYQKKTGTAPKTITANR
jgi:UrcA family protein